MSSYNVPLVHYVDGVRHVIGEAVVETDGVYWDITGKIIDPNYRTLGLNGQLRAICIGGEVSTSVEQENPPRQGS